MQIVGQRSGNSPQEVALWILAHMPLSTRSTLKFAPIKGWIRSGKINADDSEVQEALRLLYYNDGRAF